MPSKPTFVRRICPMFLDVLPQPHRCPLSLPSVFPISSQTSLYSFSHALPHFHLCLRNNHWFLTSFYARLQGSLSVFSSCIPATKGLSFVQLTPFHKGHYAVMFTPLLSRGCCCYCCCWCGPGPPCAHTNKAFVSIKLSYLKNVFEILVMP